MEEGKQVSAQEFITQLRNQNIIVTDNSEEVKSRNFDNLANKFLEALKKIDELNKTVEELKDDNEKIKSKKK